MIAVGAVLGAALWLVPASVLATDAPSGIELARQINQAFIGVAEKVSPSVVIIRVARRPDFPELNPQNHPFLDMVPELRREWEEQLKRQPRPSPRRGPVFDTEGSGVILREDGYLLTNSHVVEGAEQIIVRLKDGTEYDKVELKGIDSHSDVAVLKIDARGLPAARLGDSARTQVGEFAIAIGAPYELAHSVTVGHVSGKGRRLLQDQVMSDQDFLQTDASINPGNSGGPLVNIEGEVIGINTLIRGMNRGIGFAVPINLAREIAEKLIRDGRFTRAWLGIGIRDLNASREVAGLATGVKEGVVVTRIVSDGPAAGSELEPADVITAVDGRPTPTTTQLKSEIRVKPIGQPVTLKVIRGGQQLKIIIKPGELPDDNAPVIPTAPRAGEPASAGLGLKVQPLTRELARQFEVEMTPGVIITAVETDSPAERRGIEPGDIITRINREPVATVQQFNEALKTANLTQGVILHLTGDGGRRFEILKDSGD